MRVSEKIPDEIRKIILEQKLIDFAVQSIDNIQMVKLLKIWHEFIEPNKEMTACPICIGNILTNFKQMKEDLIRLENDSNKLSSL